VTAIKHLQVKRAFTLIKLIVSCVLFVVSLEVSAETKAAPPAAAEQGGDFVTEKRGGKTIKYKKKATYDFEGSSIEGMYNKPSGSYISNIKDVKGRSIIRIRENFDDEVIDSSRLLK